MAPVPPLLQAKPVVPGSNPYPFPFTLSFLALKFPLDQKFLGLKLGGSPLYTMLLLCTCQCRNLARFMKYKNTAHILIIFLLLSVCTSVMGTLQGGETKYPLM